MKIKRRIYQTSGRRTRRSRSNWRSGKNFHGMINLNETGGELWDLLKENTDEDKLLESMLEIYEIEPEQAQKKHENFF
mgnify:FL=1